MKRQITLNLAIFVFILCTFIDVDILRASDGVYCLDGLQTWDYWFAKDGDTYHAYYLHKQPSEPANARRIGHATSKDMWNWDSHGTVLATDAKTWNDISLATGSVVRHEGKWWMLYTARGTKTGGLGLAVSQDLYSWSRVSDGPVEPGHKRYKNQWQGKEINWRILADPYIYPEAVDGWYYVVMNVRVENVLVSQSGAIAMLRSQDLINWQDPQMLTWTEWFERAETPQIWQRNGKWYLYFGGVNYVDSTPPQPKQVVERRFAAGDTAYKTNCVFISDRLIGPFEPVGNYCITFPDHRNGYICKVVEDPQGRQVMFNHTAGCLWGPYIVEYKKDGSLFLSKKIERPEYKK